MTKTLKDNEQDLASKVAAMSEKHEGAQLALLIASTFQSKLMSKALTSPQNKVTILFTIADLIGAAVETADEFLKLDEDQAPESPTTSIDLSEYETYPAGRVVREMLDAKDRLVDARSSGKWLHLTCFNKGALSHSRLVEWQDRADLVTVTDGGGKILEVIKNRFGATS